MRFYSSLLLAAGLLTPCALHSAEVKMAGSTTVFLTIVKPNKDEVSKTTGITITAAGSTTGKGFAAMQAGQAEIVMSADSLPAFAQGMAAKGTPIKAEDYEEVYLKDSFLVVVANPGNPVSSVTEAQLQSLLKGTLSNWKDLGGNNMPIVLYFEKDTSANHTLIKSKMLKDAPFQPKFITYVENVRQIVNNVAEAQGGIGFTPENYLSDQVRVVSSYKLNQHLCFIIRKDASPEVRKVTDAFKAKL